MEGHAAAQQCQLTGNALQSHGKRRHAGCCLKGALDLAGMQNVLACAW